MRNVLHNSLPISLDKYLNLDEKVFKEVDQEIIKVAGKIPKLKIGRGSDGKLQFIENGQYNWEVIPLVDSFYAAPDLYRKREWNRLAKKLFPKLLAFVDNLPIQGLGRASILKIPAGVSSPPHIDPQFHPTSPPVPEYDRILNICFGHKKYLYMMDSMTKHRYYFEGRVNWLDVSDWHGVEPSFVDTYTLKLDVKLNAEIRTRIREEYRI